jgi:hypothetical protein
MFVTEADSRKDKAVKSIIAAAAFALIAGPVMAQSMTETKTTTTTTIAPAEETEMHDYIVQEHPVVVQPPPGFSVAPGVVIPQSVELYNFPTERHWNYEYATIGGQTVLVDPHTREVVHIFH